jgi:hypothetical protein
VSIKKNVGLSVKMRTKAVYGKISETSGVAGNVGTPLAAVCVGAAVDWPATSVKEARATRAERVERAIYGDQFTRITEREKVKKGGSWVEQGDDEG